MDADPAVTFGLWLNSRRKTLGLTLRAVEDLTRRGGSKGVSDTHLCHIERGRRDPMTISPRILRTLAEAYEVPILELTRRAGIYEGFQLSFDDIDLLRG